MMILCIILSTIVAACLIALFMRNGRQDDSRYYIDGLHIYYDRKMTGRIHEENNLKQPRL